MKPNTNLDKTRGGFTQHLAKLSAGFTIIEVMIVLAVAGLIMTIVFLAVPQLQRNARDNARQSVATRVKAEIETYAANNQGAYPFGAGGDCNAGNNYTTGTWQDFYCRYVANSAKGTVLVNDKDPSTGTSVFVSGSISSPSNNSPKSCASGGSGAACTEARPGSSQAKVIYGAKCNGENLVNSGSESTSTHSFALMIGLDRENTWFCVDNG
jgi:prepilin-type N-terminal cleavage/methylation domain-containing protein